ncbi:type IV toxin-antitoxin system AbiEi family antitoxin [Paraburkholderia sp.]|uniref:type IV toxin-antitoxin system AbiEi family antitoxin n=1 Tax=Paraburkholderia sp. TaxID=1926495 RepID=UPI002390765E|nr:type IV toxin-antitoxin system AbiEi family antitoxin [Paraburkholderia sp.]MDE1179350.1 type IV toxin-antitoxin system AbiEi family antitoxin [Paraburkholderia sp.]
MPSGSALSLTGHQVLAQACTAFADATRVFRAKAVSTDEFAGPMVDATIQFDVAGKQFRLPAHIEARARAPGLVLDSRRAGSTHAGARPLLLVAPFIAPDLARQLIERNSPFIDTAGNVYINEPEATILIGGRPRPAAAVARPATRATTRKGMQVMFALATQPGLVKEPFRTIAETSGVALSTVNQVIDDLLHRGLVAARRNGERLIPDWPKFAQEWTALYPTRLRTKLASQQFASTSRDWWQSFDFAAFDARLGGEAAAEQLTHNLRSANVTIYSHTAPTHDFLLKARLRPDPNGDVEIVEAFWPDALAEGWPPETKPSLVHPLLIYADLIASGDSRNIETAHVINEQYLATHAA